MSIAIDRLAPRAAALAFAVAFTSATLAGIGVLANHDRAVQVAHGSSTVARG